MPLPAAFTKISKTGYLVAVITFLTRTGMFMTMPFLAIYLAREGILSPVQIGTVLGVAGFVYSLTGLINGMHLDRRAYKHSMAVALILAGFCYFGFAFSMHWFYVLLFLNISMGWFRSLADINALTLLISNTEKENLSYAYSARFVGANLGVAIGPLIGGLMAAHESLFIFYLAGSIHLLLGMILLFNPQKNTKQPEELTQNNFLKDFRLICKDKSLICITMINFFLWFVYSQIDTTIPQYLAGIWRNPAIFYSILMLFNATICVFFQFLVMRWAELNSLKMSGVIGSLLFAISYLLLVIPAHSHLLFIISVIIMTFGELFTLPVNGLLTMRTAPKHLLASYNGFVNLGLLGLSLGPIFGGFGLQYLGKYTFLIDALIPMIPIYLYLKSVPD